MQITKKFCAVTLIHCGLWLFFCVFCDTSSAASAGIDHGRSSVGGPESAEIISGRPKIIYDIKSLSGEPNYKSVNLTWEIEEVQQEEAEVAATASAASTPLLPEPAFQVYYCEMQAWGPQRCKSKVLKQNEENNIDPEDRSGREFNLVIDNLRMATKYSFQVRQIDGSLGDQKAKGRKIEEDIQINDLEKKAQTIIIPTKGFDAHATKCLAQASEIEVETGPHFGGKIMVENSDCVIEGNGDSEQSTYTMQIDHERCGSKVFHNNLTVVTTVVTQENQGIFTHSTRRFLVICSYQAEMLTVRASFLVPGKGGAAAAAAETSPEWQKIAQPSRNARERQFNLVGRNALVLKENDPEQEEKDTGLALLESEGSQFKYPANDVENSISDDRANYLRLIHDESQSNSHHFDGGEFHRESDRLTGVLIAVSLSVIMIGAVVYLLKRENKKQRIAHSQRIIRVAHP